MDLTIFSGPDRSDGQIRHRYWCDARGAHREDQGGFCRKTENSVFLRIASTLLCKTMANSFRLFLDSLSAMDMMKWVRSFKSKIHFLKNTYWNVSLIFPIFIFLLSLRNAFFNEFRKSPKIMLSGFKMSRPHLRAALEKGLVDICDGRKAKNEVEENLFLFESYFFFRFWTTIAQNTSESSTRRSSKSRNCPMPSGGWHLGCHSFPFKLEIMKNMFWEKWLHFNFFPRKFMIFADI